MSRLGFLVVALKSTPVAAAGDGKRLARVQLIPPGEHSGQACTGSFRISVEPATAQAAIAAFNAAATDRDRLFDYDHRSLLCDDTRAAGRIESCEWSPDDGIVALVDWTPSARQAIADGEYRFISPILKYDSKGRVTGIRGAGLTNDPAVPGIMAVAAKRAQAEKLAALAAEGQAQPNTGKEQDMEELLKQLAAALGIEGEATQEAILAKVKDLAGAGEKAAEAQQNLAQAKEVVAQVKDVVQQAETAVAEVADAAGVAPADVTGDTVAAKARSIVAALRARGGKATGGEMAALRAQASEDREKIAALERKDLEREASDAVAALVSDKKVAGKDRVAALTRLYVEQGTEAFALATEGLQPIAALAGGLNPASGGHRGSDGPPAQQIVALTAAKVVELRKADPTLSHNAAHGQATTALRKERPELFEPAAD